jgi:hypothetical protein
MAVTQASGVSDIPARPGLAQGAAHCRARLLHRRTAGGALDHKGAAHHPRLRLNSRPTDNVSWPLSGWSPSSVRTQDPIAR